MNTEPETEKVDFTEITGEGVTWTLLGTLYLRAYEYRHQRDPILGDRYAAEAVDRIDYDWDALVPKLRPESSQYLVALRARWLDDRCRDFLARNPDATVLQLGCGLDSRMLRLDPDGELNWFDVDIPPVIELRRKIYPERDKYRMIDSSVTEEGWLDAVPADGPVLIVAEGLLMYLTPQEVRHLLRRMTDRFPSGELLFDAMSPLVARLHPLFRWSAGNGRSVMRENPRLTLADAVTFGTGYRRIPSRRYRTIYRIMMAVPGPVGRNMSRMYRYTFS